MLREAKTKHKREYTSRALKEQFAVRRRQPDVDAKSSEVS